ncbi:uncharacterized protein ASCRUDRAFT_33373, partial [Ascoidea rubescens DSM 1968]
AFNKIGYFSSYLDNFFNFNFKSGVSVLFIIDSEELLILLFKLIVELFSEGLINFLEFGGFVDKILLLF